VFIFLLSQIDRLADVKVVVDNASTPARVCALLATLIGDRDFALHHSLKVFGATHALQSYASFASQGVVRQATLEVSARGLGGDKTFLYIDIDGYWRAVCIEAGGTFATLTAEVQRLFGVLAEHQLLMRLPPLVAADAAVADEDGDVDAAVADEDGDADDDDDDGFPEFTSLSKGTLAASGLVNGSRLKLFDRSRRAICNVLAAKEQLFVSGIARQVRLEHEDVEKLRESLAARVVEVFAHLRKLLRPRNKPCARRQ
jgi:hypothetical protein